ncbi:MAG: carboxypeptidase regulatory-like domain-containing protein [Planctomycetes bacterium]|nr:carboxypeptidase regulatory-like domain-containing protein [Planctomycetota bacterium]
MPDNRFSGLNIVLLVVTVLSLMVGAYGFITSGMDDRGPAANVVGARALEGAPTADDRDAPPLHAAPETAAPRAGEAQKSPGPTTTPTPAENTAPKAIGSELQVEARSDPSDRGDAVIQGKVIGPDGAPVTGATVTARRSDLDLNAPEFNRDDMERYRAEVSAFLTRAAKESRTTTTGQGGVFRFSGLDGSLAYDLAARGEGQGSGELGRVAAGDEVTILLSAESLLRGRVETADGKPVTKFKVRAWRQNRQWEAISRGFDDSEGRFSLPAKTGLMQVEITATGFTQEKPQDIEVGADEAVLVLQRAAILTGVVSDKDGKPLANVQVRVGGGEDRNRRGWNQEGGSGPSVRTDSKGRYRFDTLTPKETRFTAELGEMSETQTVTLVQGENTLDFRMDVGAIIRLRLSNPGGEPVEADSVWFQEKGGRNWPRPERLPSTEPGLAEFAGMRPGEYTMTVTAAGLPAIKQDITVVAGANELTLKFTTGAMLTGTITSSSGSKVSNVGVRLRKEGEDRWGGWGTGRYAQVGDDGSYKLGPAEPGQWRIEVYTTGNWTEVYSDMVTLNEGENTRNVVVDAGATVIVKLVDEQGNPIAWGNVQLTGIKNFNANSNGEGVATISFVEVGSYSLVATSRGLASQSQFVSLNAGDNSVTVRMQKPNCCRLTHIYPETQASKLGLQVGDLVIEYNSEAITSWGGLGQAIRRTKATDDVIMLVERGGSMLTFNLKGGTVGIEGSDGVR